MAISTFKLEAHRFTVTSQNYLQQAVHCTTFGEALAIARLFKDSNIYEDTFLKVREFRNGKVAYIATPTWRPQR